MHSIALLGWFGAALSIALPWPQVWRSVIRGRTTGLSATACWQGTAMPVGWITYGLLTGENVQVVTNTVTGAAGLAVLVMVLMKQSELRTRRNLLVSATGAAAVLTAAAVSAAAGQLTGIGGARAAACLGAVLACAAILGAIPQPLSLLRNRSQDLAGLSPLRWWLAAAACGSWCGYGLATGQPAVWLSALVGFGSAAIVCGVLVADQRTRATAGTPAVQPVPGVTQVIQATEVRPAATRMVRPAATTARPVHGTAQVTRPTPARTIHGTAQITRPAPARTIHATAQVPGPAPARTIHGTAQVTGPVPARTVYGTARVARPVQARAARGVARVPRSADRPTLIMSEAFAPA